MQKLVLQGLMRSCEVSELGKLLSKECTNDTDRVTERSGGRGKPKLDSRAAAQTPKTVGKTKCSGRSGSAVAESVTVRNVQRVTHTVREVTREMTKD